MKIWVVLAVSAALVGSMGARPLLGQSAAPAIPPSSSTRPLTAFPKPIRVIDIPPTGIQPLDASWFSSAHGGWSLRIELQRLDAGADASLFTLSNGNGGSWLTAARGPGKSGDQINFSLKVNANAEPLIVAIPLALMGRAGKSDLLLRYRRFSLDLFCNGVLVDQEWPMGEVPVGSAPILEADSQVRRLSVWDHPLSNAEIFALNGGARQVDATQLKLLGPKRAQIQYSRPLGYNSNAGDAMPFYHDGEFHLYFLLDRRHHKSKWGLGAHQWAHISSKDLVHWTNHPLALAIDHEWEGSICTGSVFFHNGRYYAFYATRMPDRNQRLGIAESRDAVHFTKTLPTPFEEPKPPFVRGPNRDPFVFSANGQFHMIVTAAIAKNDGQSREGALEHLVSNDLKTWTVEKEPFITSGSEDEPECSDLFKWGDWYYLLFSLRGTTHYRMSRSALGPWTKPADDILDGPEAKVMKAAAFGKDRMLLTGFVQFDNRYGGELVFRELVKQSDGALGTKTPPEMRLPESAKRDLAPLHLSDGDRESELLELKGYGHLTASLSLHSHTKLTFHVKMSDAKDEELTFDSESSTVTWVNQSGQSNRTILEHVTDMGSPMKIDLVVDGNLADLEINGHRSLIHRLAGSEVQAMSFSVENGAADIANLQLSKIVTVPQTDTP